MSYPSSRGTVVVAVSSRGTVVGRGVMRFCVSLRRPPTSCFLGWLLLSADPLVLLFAFFIFVFLSWFLERREMPSASFNHYALFGLKFQASSLQADSAVELP